MTDAIQSQPFTWQQRLYGFFALARVSNSPTVASNVLAGAALAGVINPNSTIIGLMIAMIGFYTAGMYLNDILDVEIDRQERPDRPLPSGLIPMSAAWGVTLALFGLGSLILLSIGIEAFVGGLALIGLIVLYDTWHKKNPVSPLIMGANRMMVYIIAFVAFETTLTGALLGSAGLLVLYIMGLTFIAKSEASTNFTARYWPVVVLLAPAVIFGLQMPLVYLPLVAVYVAWTIYSMSFVYIKERRSIGRGIVSLIAGVALFDALVLATQEATVGIVLALCAFGLTIFFQRYIRGT